MRFLFLILILIRPCFSQPLNSDSQYLKEYNELINSGFEQGLKGWVSVAGAFTTTGANGVDRGAKAGCVSLAAQTLNLSQIIPIGNLRGQGEISAEAYSTVAGTEVCSVVDGSDIDCIPIKNLSSWKNRIEIGFVAGSTNYGIRFRSTGNITGIACLDSVYAGKMPTGRISETGAIGPWIAYTPTTQGFGTISDIATEYRVIGDSIEIRGSFVVGTSTAVEARVGLPSGRITRTITQPSSIGAYFRSGTGIVEKGGSAIPVSEQNYFTLGSRATFSDTTTNSVLIALNGDDIAASGNRLSFANLIIPIAGLNSRISLYSQQCRKPSDCENVFSAKVSAAGVVSDENLDWINGNCTGTSPYTCTFNASIFTVPPTCIASINDDANAGVRITSVTSSTATFRTVSSTPATVNAPYTLVCTKAAPDYKERNMITGTFRDVVTTPNAGTPVLCSSLYDSSNVEQNDLCGFVASNSGTSPRTFTFETGFWASTPNCWCNAGYSSGVDSNCDVSTVSTASAVARMYNGGLLINNIVTLFCHGIR
jgi:hypothetical protein